MRPKKKIDKMIEVAQRKSRATTNQKVPEMPAENQGP